MTWSWDALTLDEQEELRRLVNGQAPLTEQERQRLTQACKQVWAERFTTTMRRAA